ncbi:glycoside hydrolase family 130 protein [Flectobacillus sp. DC10W]|jgi:predicted GH43/DUF377 family glycosyl hydrolase|uniref:Glycoside hydrolase family 130 protein n=1 Tax=Flectobacillus longus TaxID=2984207 RepID=A0ABT6YUD7_9BACT|nr:glycoside hydrolase family 130 protein [Flectobacillus longus]MDI9867200.1 glycoside hydrolase family 130 protein [Flectobacillus longus]
MKNNISLASLALLVGVGLSSFNAPLSLSDVANWQFSPFTKVDAVNPVLTPSNKQVFTCPILKKEVKWEEKDVFNPAAVVRDGKVYLVYRAEDKIGKFAGTSRLGLAISSDGLHFKKEAKPIFYPENDAQKSLEWEGGCEDPRIVESAQGQYIMTYTSYDGKTARLMLATSKDLRKWTKHGLIFKAPKHHNTWSKSGAIVVDKVGDKMIAKKINGKYWMYWGDTDLFMATSTDLLNWMPVEDAKGQLVSVLKPRKGYFDSKLVEPGPYALFTTKGIVLLYNSANNGQTGDKSLPDMTYSAGQALFDASNPAVLKDRSKKYFMTPNKPYEMTGQVNNVCFVEGMVSFKNQWFLYYGTADSKIAVATSQGIPSLH